MIHDICSEFEMSVITNNCSPNIILNIKPSPLNALLVANLLLLQVSNIMFGESLSKFINLGDSIVRMLESNES